MAVAMAGWRVRAWLLAACCWCCWPAAATQPQAQQQQQAQEPPQPQLALAQWRAQLLRTAALAEQDAPAAYRQARQLQAAPAGASGAERTRALTLLARIELTLAHTATAGELAEQALEQARRQGDRAGQAEAGLVLSLNAVYQGRIDSLLGRNTDTLNSLDGVARPELLAEAMLLSALTYSRLGNLDDSVAICVRAMGIARLSALPRALAFSHRCMAVSFDQSDNRSEAMQHYQAMAVAARADGSTLLLAQAIAGQGGLLATGGDLRGGESLLRQAVQLFQALGAPFHLSGALHGLADNLARQGRHAEAVHMLDQVVAINQRYQNPIGTWWGLTARGAAHAKLGHPGAARRDAGQAHQLAREIGTEPYRGNSARQLAALAAQRGNYRDAYAYSLEAAELAARARRDKTSARVLELSARYESESKRHHIDALTQSNARQQAELERRALQQRWLWTVLGGSLALLACIAVFMARLRRSHRMVAQLNAGLEATVQRRTGALRQQTRYLRVLIDTLPWWVWFKDTDSRYLAVNRALAATWSRDVDAMVGLADEDVIPGLAAQFRQEEREVMAARSARTVETQQVTPQGTVWVETFKAPVVDEDGSVLGTVGFARDVSERKHAEAAREAALQEAQRLASLRSEFLAQMSHELRTPLNGILGHAQLLGRAPGLNEQQRAGVAVIRDSGEHLLTLINDLLDSAKIEASKLEAQLGPVPLRRCLQSLAELVRVRAEQKQLAFQCDIGAAVPALVLTDEQRLRQALLNLLANAVKFTDRGGVTLRVQALDGERLRFEVSDTGVGIEAEQLERIFLPFEQAGEAQRRHGGTGLGLAISRQFVRLLGGEISVESQQGRGCRFWFELALPVLRRAGQAPETPPEEHAGAPLVVPPPDEMAVLHHLVQLGNMRDIIERADHLERVDGCYRPFAGQLRQLARGYQSQALLQLVERHLGRPENTI